MGKESRVCQKNNSIKLNVAEAFGYSDDQLAEEYDRAATAETGTCPPPAPSEEFEKILAKIEKKTDKFQPSAEKAEGNKRKI